MSESYEERLRRGGLEAVRAAGRFFMGDDAVPRSLRRLAGKLDQLGIPCSVVGGMAVSTHG